MNKIRNTDSIGQAEFREEIRRRCRIAVEQYGGLRKFAGKDEGNWTNRFDRDRVVGFDVSWMIQVLETTGDHRVLIPFFMRGNTVNVDLLDRLCKALKYFIFPCERDQEGSTSLTISHLLRGAEKLLSQSRRLRLGEGR